MDFTILEQLAGHRSAVRGQNYFNEGRVTQVTRVGDQVVGVVEGRERYSVTLSLEKGVIDGECSCPASEHSEFCKHCVAVALALSAQQQAPSWLVAHLKRLKKEQLIEALINEIAADSRKLSAWEKRINTPK
ncbi:SWIM zinc finger family protein [Ferrimonas kyonanensis]|uniref:SWIM zinc finger family protein n=1 Tax=Ferrimonas kyonanensis TaxID=364763 RepID=UPI0003FBCE3D|nr:SWIM zinc finger family protein [Ferrimonas kyonanensis]